MYRGAKAVLLGIQGGPIEQFQEWMRRQETMEYRIRSLVRLVSVRCLVK